MTDPRYMRMAKAAKDELGALDVVIVVRGRSGLLTIGYSGPAAERMAYAALDAALDLRPTDESDHKEPADTLARLLDNLDPELEHAWGVIARVYGNLLCHDWRTGEIWQYMGTYHRAGAWSHHFRHRCLPATGKRTVYKVAASTGWTP